MKRVGNDMINIVEGVKKYSKTDRIAVICRDKKLYYKDLDRYSDILANFLIKNKMNDRPVGIYANKNVNILVCMIASLKMGQAYVPMDISFPEQRVSDVIEAIEPRVVFDFSDGEYFYDDKCAGRLKEKYENVKIIDEKELLDILEHCDELAVSVDKENWVDGDENSYILFT